MRTRSAADLAIKGPSDALIFEEVLGASSGLAVDADPSHRCVVRLNADPIERVDPINGVTVVDISWFADDALPVALCMSDFSSRARDMPSRAGIRRRRRAHASDSPSSSASGSYYSYGYGVPPTYGDGSAGAPVSGPGAIMCSVARANVALADHGVTIVGQALIPLQVPTTGKYRPQLQNDGLTHAAPYDDPGAPGHSTAADATNVDPPFGRSERPTNRRREHLDCLARPVGERSV